MINECTERNEIQAMERKYREVLAWEAEFAQQIEELKKIDESDKEALKVANDILKAYDERKNITGKKINIALASNSKRIDRLEAALKSLGYLFTKYAINKHNGIWFEMVSIHKLNNI
ncbi:hypothetical protein [Brevibacillus porteri]|uniref:hypothetical protein n=1 Tax=Brevibacillus porteri TaxID=2126350 RepID=UPI003643A0E0